jgi:pyrroline-5-carboxylate reductase
MYIRIIGCGAMGSAIAERLRLNGHHLALYDKEGGKAEALSRSIQAKAYQNPLEGTSAEEWLLLAVKPQDFAQAIPALSPFPGELVLSVIAGISQSELAHAFPDKTVLRMMPNLAVQYGTGIVALADHPNLQRLKNKIQQLLKPLGYLHWLPESSFHALTALAGSGPAFVFTLIEAMVDAAVAMGLPAEMSLDLVQEMFLGAISILSNSKQSTSALKWKVTSPGGTTIAGLRELERCNVRSGIIETLLAAYERALDLSK